MPGEYEEGELNSYRDERRDSSRSRQTDKKRKSKFSGRSPYEKDRRRDRSSDRKRRDDRSRSRSRSYHSSRHHRSSRRSRSRSYSRSGSHHREESRASQELKAIEDAVKNNSPSVPSNSAPTESTEVEAPVPVEEDPNNVHKQCELAAIEARKRAMNLLYKMNMIPADMIEQPEEEAPAPEEPAPAPEEPVPAPVNPLLPKIIDPNADGGSGGPLSWYKPTSTSTNALKSILEKK